MEFPEILKHMELLCILSQHPNSTVEELAHRIVERFGSGFAPTSSVYRYLTSLHRDGIVTYTLFSNPRKFRRNERKYMLTPDGREELEKVRQHLMRVLQGLDSSTNTIST